MNKQNIKKLIFLGLALLPLLLVSCIRGDVWPASVYTSDLYPSTAGLVIGSQDYPYASGVFDEMLTWNGSEYTDKYTGTRGLLDGTEVNGTWVKQSGGDWTIPGFIFNTSIYGDGTHHIFMNGRYIYDAQTILRTVNNSGTTIYGGTSDSAGAGIAVYGNSAGGNAGLLKVTTPTATSYAPRFYIYSGSSYVEARFRYVSKLNIESAYLEMQETTAPGAGGTNTARVYASEGGDGLTDLNAVFQDGTVDTFAQEATKPDSPIMTYPNGTEGKLVMLKPNPGTIQFVMQFPDGENFVMKTIEYHSPDKISWNKGAVGPLPEDWFIDTGQNVTIHTDNGSK